MDFTAPTLGGAVKAVLSPHLLCQNKEHYTHEHHKSENMNANFLSQTGSLFEILRNIMIYL